MKLQRTTLILILLALGLGSFVYFYEIRGASQREEAKQKQQQIFNFAADDVQSLTINKKTQIINIERNPSPEAPKWLLKSPVSTTPANSASVSYLMDLLVKGNSSRTISTSTNQLSEFGLDQPLATIAIELKNQKSHSLTLGQPDFNRRYLYALVDPNTKSSGQVNVSLISTDFENAVNREQSEWQQPVDNPKQSTPLPLPTFNTPNPK
jgi:hypothetical protein